MLVQVDNFYYPVDFIVLDLQGPHSNISSPTIILGRPFLATSNAIIHCKDGRLKLSFGNLALELNIFNSCKMPVGGDELEEVNMITSIVDDTLNKTMMI